MATKKILFGKRSCIICSILLLATILFPLSMHYDHMDKQMKFRKINIGFLSFLHRSKSESTEHEVRLRIDKELDEIEAAVARLQDSEAANKEETNEEVRLLKEKISVLRNEMTGLPGGQNASAATKNKSSSYRLRVNSLYNLLHRGKNEKTFNIEFTKPKEELFSLYKHFDATMFFIVYVLSITFFTVLTVVSIKGLRRQEQYDLYEQGKKEFWLMLKTSSNRESYQEQFMQEMMRLYFNKKDE